MFALAYIVLSENLQAKVFGTSVGIIAAINGGVGGVDGYVGGLMTETLGFRSIFVVLVLTAVAAVCIFRLVPAGRPVGVRGAMDWWGAGSLSLFLVFLTYFVADGSAAGWTSPTALALLAGTVASFAAFWMIEKRRSHPLIAVHHLRSRQVWPVIATTVLTPAGIFAISGGPTAPAAADPHRITQERFNRPALRQGRGLRAVPFIAPALRASIMAGAKDLMFGPLSWMAVSGRVTSANTTCAEPVRKS